jgi:predicted DNA-binding protein
MSTDFSRFTLRLPVEMREWLTSKAKANHRTLTAEIIEMIREAMQKETEEQKKAA